MPVMTVTEIMTELWAFISDGNVGPFVVASFVIALSGLGLRAIKKAAR